MSYDTLTYMLVMLNVIFLFVVAAWYFTSTPNQKVLHGKKLLGTWQRKGKSPQGEPWHINHTFKEDGTFSIEAQPAYSVKGKYRIIKEVEHLLTLELHGISGDGDTRKRLMQVALDPAAGKIVIEGRTYTKPH